MRHVVIVLGDAGRTKGVGLDQIGASGHILLVNFLNDVRLSQRQQFIIAFDENLFAGHREIGKARAAIIFLTQLVALNHGAHRTVEDQNPLCQQ